MEESNVTFLGFFGRQNLGNECTLQAIISNTRRYVPGARCRCVCVVPEDTTTRHSIPAFPIVDSWPTVWIPQWLGTSHNRLVLLGRRILVRVLRSLAAFSTWLNALRILRTTDVLIIPGTGLLTDAYSRPFGWPYHIFIWCVTAKLCGCNLLFISVGAGPIYHPLSKWFIKTALFLADYRSYRDAGTLQYLRSVGVATQGDRVVPDLAFLLPPGMLGRCNARRKAQRPVIGVGLMHYAGRLSVARPLEQTYQCYLQALAQFVVWLLEHEYDVSLLIGDATDDMHVVHDLQDVLRQHSTADMSRIVDAPILTVEELLTRLSETDAVVATRFHNALLALVLEKPVIMISFHDKCVSLMQQMDLGEYCTDINSLSGDALIESFNRLQANAPGVKERIRRKVEENRRAVEAQYEAILAKESSAGAG